ncbi:MAG: phosphatase PAP2 family protein [Sedimentisphaerales bacterium]
MENKMTDNRSSEKKRLFVVILLTTGLALLGIASYFFLDERVVAWLVQNPSYFKKTLLIKAVVQLGKVWLPVWLLLCWALLAGRRQETMIALIALFLLVFSLQPLKVITQRPRPRDVIEHSEVNDKPEIFHNCSFPSGDTASVFAVAVAISPFIGWFAGSIVFVLAVCVGALRVVSFAHYPSDVFAGAAIGVLSGYLAYYLFMSVPFLKINLVKLLSFRNVLLGVIIIPAVVVLFGGLNNFLVFLEFYPPIVIVLYLLYKIRKPQKPEIP